MASPTSDGAELIGQAPRMAHRRTSSSVAVKAAGQMLVALLACQAVLGFVGHELPLADFVVVAVGMSVVRAMRVLWSARGARLSREK